MKHLTYPKVTEIWEQKLIVIVPAYNEEKTVSHVVRQIKTQHPQSTVLVVDDGSEDSTSCLALEHGAKVISLPINCGIGVAMRLGYRFALRYGFEYAVQVDADGQHNPQFIERLVRPLLNQECDMVIGSRFLEKQGFVSSKLRRVGIRFFSILIFILTKKWITDPTSGNRALNQNALQLLASDYPSDYPEPEALMILHNAEMRIKEIPTVMGKRVAGKSSISFGRAVYYMIKVSLSILGRFFDRSLASTRS